MPNARCAMVDEADVSLLAKSIAWLIAPALFAAMIALNPLSRPSYLMGDFRAFYCAGVAIVQGANPYLEEPLRSCEARTGPPAEPAFLRGVAVPAPLPPYALLFFVPFARLPFPIAALIYGAMLLASMAASVALFARVTGVSSFLLNLAFAAITATVTLYVGQPVPMVFLAIAAAAVLARSGRWTAAAICVALASIEPHVALAAIVGMLVAFPRTRLPIMTCGVGLTGVSVLAFGLPTTIAYVRDVVPAHAVANAYEWQFSLTSILTSVGVSAQLAIHCGELMFAAMVALGVVVAYRLWRATGDRAVMVIVPPAFAVFGGVHVHFQQLAIAFPAMLYVLARYPRARILAGTGIALAMIPWNVMSSMVLSGLSPVLVGAFCWQTVGERRGLVLTGVAGIIALSLLALAYLGLGPHTVEFVAHAYSPNALAESSWGDFSRAALARPSLMMQWLRLPTLVGLACGLIAIVRVAYRVPARDRTTAVDRAVAVPV